MDKDAVLNKAKKDLQIFEKAQNDLLNAQKNLIQSKEDVDGAIEELMEIRKSIEEALNTLDEKKILSAESDENLEKAEDENNNDVKEDESPPKRKTRAQSSKKRNEETELEVEEDEDEDELDLDFLDDGSYDSSDIDRVEF